ncbi:hypothetical protein ACWEPC_04255 [Nonomuraea sp. NPDC004297]
MGLGDAVEALGPVLTVIGSVAMLGRQILLGRSRTPAPASLPKGPTEGNGASILVVVHILYRVKMQPRRL